MPPKTKDEVLDILVTCPHCAHTHVIKLNEADLPLRRNTGRQRMYKLSEVAKILGLSRRTIKQYIYDGKLHAEHFTDGPTSPWYVSESALADFRRSRGER
jgi:hypothetical protein